MQPDEFQPRTTMRRFPIPLNTTGRLQNLGNHLLLMAQASDVGYARPSASPDRGDGSWREMREFLLPGLVELIGILDPKRKPTIGSPRQRVATSQLFVELWNHVVVEEKGGPEQIARAVRGAEQLLVNCAVATACYVNEVVTVLARPEDCFALLRRAAQHRLSGWDHELLRSAVTNVVDCVSASIKFRDGTAQAERPLVPNSNTTTPAANVLLTANQQSALERIQLMGELFFSSSADQGAFIRPKLFPLLAGPTGGGKSFIVREAVRRIGGGDAADAGGAIYHRITRGDWTVQHARYGLPTIYQLIELAAKHDRVVVHVDELDKFVGLFGGAEWSASLAADLWNALDKQFPFADFFAADQPAIASMAARKMSTEELRQRVTRNLWFVGSGTWQSVFAAERKSPGIGFNPNQPASVSGDSIACANTIPAELLSRFNADIIILKYPDPAETDLLLDRFGIRTLARELGIEINPQSIDWQTGGMRVLESLQTRLLLEKHKRRSEQHR